MSALVSEIDAAGYLGLEEVNAAQKARIDFAAHCSGLAVEYLARHPEPLLAKQALKADFKRLETQTDTGRFDDDEAALVGNFLGEVEVAIDRESEKSGWKRFLTLWIFRTPRIFIVLFIVAVVIGVADTVGRTLAK